jgi:chromosome segregation ATPase
VDRPGEAGALSADLGMIWQLWKRRQNVMTSWKIVAVFVAAALTGCATKGDLQELRTQVATTESTVKASETSIKSIEEKLTAQDARLAEAEKSQLLTAKQLSDATDRLAALAQTQTQVAKQLADLDAQLKTLDESIAKAAGRMDKNEAQITNLNNQANAWDTDLKLVKDQMVKLNATVGKANTMYRKNLENMRDVYKRQFEAVSEILEKEKE